MNADKKRLDFFLLRRFVLDEMRPYYRRIAFATLLMIVTAVTSTASAWVIQFVIDDLFVSKRADLVVLIVFAVIAIYLVRGISSWGYQVIVAKISASMAADMRAKMAARLLRREIPFFDRTSTSNLINNITNVTKSAGELVNTLTSSLMRDGMTVIALFSYMLYMDPLLTLGTVLVAPPIIYGVGLISSHVRHTVAGEFLEVGHFMHLLYERFGNMRLIKAFEMEEDSQQKLGKSIEKMRGQASRIGRISALSSPLTEILGGIMLAVIIAYSSLVIIKYDATPGEMFSFIVAFINAYEPIKNLSKVRVNIVKRSVPLGFYYALLDEVPTFVAGDQTLPDNHHDIVFENVSFTYPQGKKAIDSLSFRIPAGKRVAIIGRSGSGKSTIFSLLQNFYVPDSGRILIGDVEVGALSDHALRQAIAPIPQHTTIIQGNVYENLLLANANKTRDEIFEVARAAHVDEFVQLMPQGYETALGDGGSALSGGQMQRLSIARAILNDSPIWLLDEPTSALDQESESKVRDALAVEGQGKTILLIAHRLRTIQDADWIFVMDQGRLVEEGTHTDLLEKRGLYAELQAKR